MTTCNIATNYNLKKFRKKRLFSISNRLVEVDFPSVSQLTTLSWMHNISGRPIFP